MAARGPDTDNLGWKAPAFSLPGTDGGMHGPATARGDRGLLVMFICNHCPYVRSIIDRIVRDTAELATLGVGSIAVMSNDTDSYPADSFDRMKEFARENGFGFPYVIDETQAVARSYDAVCTPEFYGFNAGMELQYRGRLDESGRAAISGARRDLFEAMRLIAETGAGPAQQIASIGCSIKWRAA
ncbi:MAG: thioredoxin family protein [Rhodospirillales bacterium]